MFFNGKISLAAVSAIVIRISKFLNESTQLANQITRFVKAFISIKRLNGENHLQIKQGYFNQDNDIVLFDSIYQNDEIEFILKFKGPDKYQLGFNGIILKETYNAYPGRWIGGKIGIFAKGLKKGGSATYKYFNVRRNK